MSEDFSKYRSRCEVLSQNTESTVVARYTPKADSVRESAYQSEAELEARFIGQLKAQGFEYLPLKTEDELVANLRRQLELLNDFKFSDAEWKRFFRAEIGGNAGEADEIEAKTRTIQQDYVKHFVPDNGPERNIYLIDKRRIHANRTQVINQYTPSGGARENRYDVTILVNGLPLVHVELKRRGVSLQEAFNQINRYARESFWAGTGLFEYVQIFVISNGTQTKYYSNTTRRNRVNERQPTANGGRRRAVTSNSFEFTSFWSDATNRIISDLEGFTETFFSRHTLLNVLTRYCVFTEQKQLLVMRPYQIAATERLINRIELSHNHRRFGNVEAGGYIWHTTGSGKTLTSFKAAQIASELPYIDKVFFVVDRKDLDYQTMREYDRFQKGAANGNTSTKELKRQIESSRSRIIITTIQKLSTFVSSRENKGHAVYDKEVVFIFDECHRSQFGQMHAAIVKNFKKYCLFGFTGTPIFAQNVVASAIGGPKTTESVFGACLHSYNIVDAIRDRNVLPFRIDYVRTIREKEEVERSRVWDIAREKALAAPERIANVTAYILENFARQTKRDKTYSFSRTMNVAALASDKKKSVAEERKSVRVRGFNSLFAVQNIEFAKKYYVDFKKQMAGRPSDKQLKVAVIFTCPVNEDIDSFTDDENPDNVEGLDESSCDFLDDAIGDYNRMFHTNYDTSSDKFSNYYKDVSQRMKNREIDILIVVNMFLTGFDATTLNTLWVDKNLRYHGLLQAFSRTNRILNSIKVAGNIVCFRNLDDATNDALALFGDSEAHSVVVLRKFEDYMNGYEDNRGRHVKGYTELLDELRKMLQPGDAPVSEKREKRFIELFGAVLRMRNLLTAFDQFKDPLTERDRQDYTSTYLALRDKYRGNERADINDDIIFEMELVKQVEVGIDYILFLVTRYHARNCKDKEIRIDIQKAVDASPDLRDKKELIERFVDSLTPKSNIEHDWKEYVNACKRAEFGEIVKSNKLRPKEATAFIREAWERGFVPESGKNLNRLLPKIDIFKKNNKSTETRLSVLASLKAFFTKFFSVADGEF